MLRNWFLSVFAGILIIFGFSGASAEVRVPDNTQELNIQVKKGLIRSGDTASSLLNKYLPLKSIYEISRQSKDIFSLSRIRKGRPYKIITNENGFLEFEYEIDSDERFVVRKEEEHFSVGKLPIYYDVNLELVSATISYSLNSTVRKIGEKNELAFRLADIFAWDIDFIRDIHSGDQFRVLVEKKYRNGKLCGYGKIKAAFFTNRGTTYKAFLHTDNEGISGYYDEQGNSLQKAFLKAPLAYSRISSKFTNKRLHPILKRYRAHKGVDYAAPTGTPIKTVGDGIITDLGYSKSTGNYIRIRHFNGYTTRYYHMSGFTKGMKRNKRVLQGEKIGYVGATGLATGPHLCFGLKKNGKYIDPLNYRAPSAKPVRQEEMDIFLSKTMALSERILMASGLASAKKPST